MNRREFFFGAMAAAAPLPTVNASEEYALVGERGPELVFSDASRYGAFSLQLPTLACSRDQLLARHGISSCDLAPVENIQGLRNEFTYAVRRQLQQGGRANMQDFCRGEIVFQHAFSELYEIGAGLGLQLGEFGQYSNEQKFCGDRLGAGLK